MKKYNTLELLTEEQFSVALGSALGDSRISAPKGKNTNARLVMMNGYDQLEYLCWKAEILKGWGASVTGPQRTNWGGLIYRAATKTHPEFTRVMDVAKSPDAIMERMSMLALAVLFMDDGNIQRNMLSGAISTHSLESGVILAISEWMGEQGIPNVISTYSKGTIIRLRKSGVNALVEKIGGIVPKCMDSKMMGIPPEKKDRSLAPVLTAPPVNCPVCGLERPAKKSARCCGKDECQREIRRRFTAKYRAMKKSTASE